MDDIGVKPNKLLPVEGGPQALQGNTSWCSVQVGGFVRSSDFEKSDLVVESSEVRGQGPGNKPTQANWTNLLTSNIRKCIAV